MLICLEFFDSNDKMRNIPILEHIYEMMELLKLI